MQARRTAIEQLAALRRGVLDAVLADCLGVVAQFVQPRRNASGILAPHMALNFLICPALATGMIPGNSGASTAAALR